MKNRFILLQGAMIALCVLLNSLSYSVRADFVVSTIAGNGIPGNNGDGEPALNAQITSVYGITVDMQGNLYMASVHRVRKVDTQGIISTIAGTGNEGDGSDGKLATSTSLVNAHSVTIDKQGNLYIADWGNHRIRKVNKRGLTTTIAGNGTYGYSGDGGLAVNAQLYFPDDIVIDEQDNLYISDAGNYRIRKVDKQGIITTIAGGGKLGCNANGVSATSIAIGGYSGITLDKLGNLYIGDGWHSCVRKINPQGIVTTVAGTGTAGYSGDGKLATQAELHSPYNVAVDSKGNLYILDRYNYCIRKVNIHGIISTVAGTGSYGYSDDGAMSNQIQFGFSSDIDIDGEGNLYLADGSNHRIRKLIPQSHYYATKGRSAYSQLNASKRTFWKKFQSFLTLPSSAISELKSIVEAKKPFSSLATMTQAIYTVFLEWLLFIIETLC